MLWRREGAAARLTRSWRIIVENEFHLMRDLFPNENLVYIITSTQQCMYNLLFGVGMAASPKTSACDYLELILSIQEPRSAGGSGCISECVLRGREAEGGRCYRHYV